MAGGNPTSLLGRYGPGWLQDSGIPQKKVSAHGIDTDGPVHTLGEPGVCEEDDGSAIENLPLLTPAEEAAFKLLSSLDPPRKLRLEQERIPFSLVKQAIHQAVLLKLPEGSAPRGYQAGAVPALGLAYDSTWKHSE